MEETIAQIKQYLNILKLQKMEKVLEEELVQAVKENLPASKVIERLLAIEAHALLERRIERRIKGIQTAGT